MISEGFENVGTDYIIVFSRLPTTITYQEVLDITSPLPYDSVMINDGPVTNCIIKPILSRFTDRRGSILQQMGKLPAPFARGKPKAGEVQDPSITDKCKWLTRELSNLSTRIERLEEHNARFMEMGGIKHCDLTTLRQIDADSWINSLTITTPLKRNKPCIHIDNPTAIGKVHGVDKTAVKLMLFSPSQVEAWGEGVSFTSTSFITSAAEPVKLRINEMQAKYDEIKSDPHFNVYPSASFPCLRKIACLDGTRYELDSDYAN
jgi:hypothetical protein